MNLPNIHRLIDDAVRQAEIAYRKEGEGMNRVSNITGLGEFVKPFTGKTIDEAIKAAETWSQRNNVQLASNYYLQVKLGQSEAIIVDLQPIKGNDNENEY